MNNFERALRTLVTAVSIAGLSLALIGCSQSSDDEQAAMEQPAPAPAPAAEGGPGAPPEGAPPPGDGAPPPGDGAPPPGGGPGGGMSRVDQVMAAISGLTDEQSTQVMSILQGTEEAIGNLQSAMPEWNEESMAAINKLWDQEADTLHEVLDEAQQAEYDAWAKAWLAERAQDEH